VLELSSYPGQSDQAGSQKPDSSGNGNRIGNRQAMGRSEKRNQGQAAASPRTCSSLHPFSLNVDRPPFRCFFVSADNAGRDVGPQFLFPEKNFIEIKSEYVNARM